MKTWDDLVDFLFATGSISKSRCIGLKELGRNSPEDTLEAVRTALRLRDSLRHIFEAKVAGERVDPLWVEPINRILQLTDGHEELQELAPQETDSGLEGFGRWALRFVASEQRLEWLLAAIARSAAEILSEGPAAPVRKCANPRCGLLFYDDSRTGKRRWCSMAVCGNRHKAAEHAKRLAATTREGKSRERSTRGKTRGKHPPASFTD